MIKKAAYTFNLQRGLRLVLADGYEILLLLGIRRTLYTRSILCPTWLGACFQWSFGVGSGAAEVTTLHPVAAAASWWAAAFASYSRLRRREQPVRDRSSMFILPQTSRLCHCFIAALGHKEFSFKDRSGREEAKEKIRVFSRQISKQSSVLRRLHRLLERLCCWGLLSVYSFTAFCLSEPSTSRVTFTSILHTWFSTATTIHERGARREQSKRQTEQLLVALPLTFGCMDISQGTDT